jgi:DNA-binding transcriptional LysR family regulator
MKPALDMDALRTMVVGTDMKSFARAASHLGRSQSAVSMQLKKLEQQTGQTLFRRSGRGLVLTEAGEALLAYARRIIALNDEATASLGTVAALAAVRIGLPQDFFDDVMPETITRFARHWPNVHVEVSAGRNYALEEEVRAGRLDVAIAFFPAGSDTHGTLVASQQIRWLASDRFAKPATGDPLALVLNDHPCLFRQTALQTLESKKFRWRLSLTTPSLPGIWAAVRSGHGLSLRTAHGVPLGITDIGKKFGLPDLPAIELRMLSASNMSPAALGLQDILREVTAEAVAGSAN